MSDCFHSGFLSYSVLDEVGSNAIYSSLFHRHYFVAGALALGDVATDGEGLAAGLELVAGVLAASLGAKGDEAVEGVVVFVELELLAGSQATAKMIEDIASSSIAMRLKMFWLLMICASFPAGLKSETIIARR